MSEVVVFCRGSRARTEILSCRFGYTFLCFFLLFILFLVIRKIDGACLSIG